jgi:hypothetical protein
MCLILMIRAAKQVQGLESAGFTYSCYLDSLDTLLEPILSIR